MKQIIFTLAMILFGFNSFAQSPIGTWATKDDKTGEIKSHVQIYEKDGKIYGKIVKLLIKPENIY